jgi:hypothetical protein
MPTVVSGRCCPEKGKLDKSGLIEGICTFGGIARKCRSLTSFGMTTALGSRAADHRKPWSQSAGGERRLLHGRPKETALPLP